MSKRDLTVPLRHMLDYAREAAAFAEPSKSTYYDSSAPAHSVDDVIYTRCEPEPERLEVINNGRNTRRAIIAGHHPAA